MKKRTFLFLLSTLLLFCCGTVSASQKKSSGKLAPPPIVLQWNTERLKVAETGSFTSIDVTEPRKKGKKPSKKISSAAAGVTENGKKFTWKPSPLTSSAIRVADLTGIALSEDGSLAVIAERIGGEGKANSTRLLYFDIPNCRLAGGCVIPELLITDIAFLPGSGSEILGIRKGFVPFKTRPGIVRISLKEKIVTDALDSPAGEILSFAADSRQKIYFTVAGRAAFYEIHADQFAVEPLEIKCSIPSPRLCAADSQLILYGKKGVELFSCSNNRWHAEEEFAAAPASFDPRSCVSLEKGNKTLCFIENYEGDLWFLQGKQFKKLKERISGIAAWDHKEKLFFVEIASKSQVCIFTMPEAAENAKPVAPNRLRPASRNGSFALLSSPAFKQQMLQVDNRGNIFLLDYSRLNRWKKTSVYIADRTAFR